MADATPALERMEGSLRALRNRMKLQDPRKQRVDLLLLRVADRFGKDSTAAKIARVDTATAAIDALFGAGTFKPGMDEAEAAVNAL
jgi:hypothetical protein